MRILLDNIAQFLFFIIYPFYYFFRIVIRTKEIHPQEEKKILIIKLFGMGSLIKMTQHFKEQDISRDNIYLLTLSSNQLICNVLDYSQVIFIDSRKPSSLLKSLFNTILAVRKIRPSIIINYEKCAYSVLLFSMLLALINKAMLIAFLKRGKSFLASYDKFYTVQNLTQKELFLSPLAYFTHKKSLNIEEKTIWQAIDPYKLIVNINASDLALHRRYPKENFEKMILLLYKYQANFRFYLSGSQQEYEYVQDLVNNLKNKCPEMQIFNCCRTWNLKRFIEELQNCLVFISGDSGPLHLAYYLKIKQIAVWGITSSAIHGYSNNSHIHNLHLDLPCMPCFTHPRAKIGKTCNYRIDCLKGLPPQWIVSEIKKIYQNTPNHRAIPQLYAETQEKVY